MDVTRDFYPVGIGQAYCLYIRRPYGRRIQTACRGEPRTPIILQRCDPQKERIKLKPTTKQK